MSRLEFWIDIVASEESANKNIVQDDGNDGIYIYLEPAFLNPVKFKDK